MDYDSTQYTISWFRQQDENGSLVLTPRFQRRKVWTPKQKSSLIDSVLSRLPVPELFMSTRSSASGETTYTVVDGQQRLTAILEFIGSGNRIGYEIGDLDHASEWDGISFADLTNEEKERLFSYRLAVRQLTGVTLTDVEDLFRRFNKYLTPLNAQELRNATYAGQFIKLSEQLADDNVWIRLRMFTPQDVRRMRDIEYVSDLIIGIVHGPQSGSAATIDEYYLQFETFPDSFDPTQNSLIFNQTIDYIEGALNSAGTGRWANKSDFYSLFLVLAWQTRQPGALSASVGSLGKRLAELDNQITEWRSAPDDSKPILDRNVSSYIEAVIRGSSDQSRRAQRHSALGALLEPVFDRSYLISAD